MINKKKKIIIAMSGGVDSSITAWLLKKQNYIVEGLFMKNWEENDNKKYCSSKKNLKDVKKICKKLKIYLHKINFSYEYWNKVFKKFLKEYKKGNTPNPDILCNQKIKFKILLKYSINILKADYLATGHYAINKNINNKNFLYRGLDLNKDQTYFLYTLNYKKIKKIYFPLGFLTKKIIKKIANKKKFLVANKKSSTGICFIEPKNFKNFLKKYISKKKGKIFTIFGKNIGFHEGVSFYTIGQRKGMKIGGIKNFKNSSWYIIDKNIKKNILIVSQGKNNIYLKSYGFIIKNICWFNCKILKKKFFCNVQIRYRMSSIKCNLFPINNKKIKVILYHSLISVTLGQSAVFYKFNCCIGGGIIEKVFLINNVKY